MRALVIACAVFGLGSTMALSADKPRKVTEKDLLGEWQMKTIKKNGGKDEFKKSIEFRKDKTYTWIHVGQKMEGTYVLKGNDLWLTKQGQRNSTIWKNLMMKDGKIIHPANPFFHIELTPIKTED